MRPASAAFTLLSLVSYAAAAKTPNYTLQDAYVGGGFLTTWDWWTEDDPTHGSVNYVDLGTALAHNLTYGAHATSLRLFVWRRSRVGLCFCSYLGQVRHARRQYQRSEERDRRAWTE